MPPQDALFSSRKKPLLSVIISRVLGNQLSLPIKNGIHAQESLSSREFAFLRTDATEMRQVQFAFAAREARKAASILPLVAIFGLAVSSLFVSVQMR